MSPERFDLIVVGAGSAAREGAKRAATEYGASVALIESTRWGGSCPTVACKPTKVYLVAADLLHDINEVAGVLGIEVGHATANLARIKARKDDLVGTQAAWLERLEDAGYATIAGAAAFVDARTLRVSGRTLTSDRILVATGSRTAVPPIDGIADVAWIDHVSALELTELPESLLVLGAGAVGLELGQALSRFGSQVTIVDTLGRIAPRSDADASLELAAALEDEGIEIVVDTVVERVREVAGAIVALASKGGGRGRELRVSQILLSSGRAPNVEELDLAAAGVETTKDGIAVDERLRTSAAGIWAAGDVTAIAQLTPVAQYQARIAIDDMFATEGLTASYEELPQAIFTDPELAAVGLSEQEALERGLEIEAVTHELRAVSRASYTNTKRGLFKLVFERGSRRLLGVHVVARGASDIVQPYAVAMRLGATVDDVARAHHAFPTFGEGVKAAAEQAKVEVAAP